MIYSTDSAKHGLDIRIAQCTIEERKYVLEHTDLWVDLLKQNPKSSRLIIYQHQQRHAAKIEPKQLPKEESIELHKKRLLENPYDESLASVLFEQLKNKKSTVDALFMQEHVLDAAAFNNSKRPGSNSIDSERFQINIALILYYFQGDLAENFLTRTMQLRFYLSNQIFPTSEISKLFTEQEFALFTLINCLRSPYFTLYSNVHLKPYLKNMNKALIDEIFVQKLIEHIEIDNIADLNQSLKGVFLINPALVEQIIEIQIVKEKASADKESIMNQQNEAGRLRIEQRVRQKLASINELSVDFSTLNTVLDVSTRKNELVSELTRLKHIPENMAAEDTLRLLKKNSLIQEKLTEINTKAELQEEKILEEKNRIKNIDTPKEEPLELHKKRLLENPYDESLASALFEQLKNKKSTVDALFMQEHVLDAAAFNNSKRSESNSIDSERFRINIALMLYYFQGDLAEDCLTRTMQLRFYLSNQIFPTSEISKLFTEQEFALFTLINCLRSPYFTLYSNVHLKPYLKNMNKALIDEIFVQKLIEHIEIDNIADLNQSLKGVFLINPALVEQIIEIQIVKEKASADKESIMNQQNEAGRLRIEQRVRQKLASINELSVDFSTLNTVLDVSTRKNELVSELTCLKHIPENMAAEDTLRLLKKNSPIQEKLTEINTKAELQEEKILKEKNRIRTTKINLLQTIHFNSRLDSIEQMKKRLEKKAEVNSKYKKAANKASILFEQLSQSHRQFLNNSEITLDSFKKEINDEIILAMPVLKEHRGWKKILVSLANALLSLAELSGIKSKNSTWPLFQVSTKSEKTIEDFSEAVNRLDTLNLKK